MSEIKNIKIDRGLCIGVGTCVVLAENTFELDDELIAVLKQRLEPVAGKSKNKDSDPDIIAAAKSCPVLAIILKDEKGKQIYP